MIRKKVPCKNDILQGTLFYIPYSSAIFRISSAVME